MRNDLVFKLLLVVVLIALASAATVGTNTLATDLHRASKMAALFEGGR